MIDYLRRSFPQQTGDMSANELSSLVLRSLDDARSYKLVGEQDLRRYFGFVVRYGPGFGQEPKTAWAKEILYRTDLEAHQKLNLLAEYELFGNSGQPT
jgi:hypothetical protein